jgi:hypothetical protein
VDVWLDHSVRKPVFSPAYRGLLADFNSSQPLACENIENNPLNPLRINRFIEQFFQRRGLSPYPPDNTCVSTLYAENGFIVEAEDIVPCNTLYKLIGRCLLRGVETKNTVCVTSSQIDFEMIDIAVQAKISTVVSLQSATSLALRLALTHGISVIGYASNNRYTVFISPKQSAS